MSDFLDIIEKYKFGIFAAVATYLVLFIYLHAPTMEYEYVIKEYHQIGDIEIPKDDIQLKLENIQIAKNDPVTNAIRNANDSREQSNENWSNDQSLSEVEQSVYELEKKMYEEAGGEAEREHIRQQMEARKQSENQTSTSPSQTNTQGSENTVSGKVLVEWNLASRRPHLNNSRYIRIPGYMCGHGASGAVTVQIKVNQNGDVINASANGGNYCMKKYAEEYALKSRFNYNSDAPKYQTGTITYTYVSQ